MSTHTVCKSEELPEGERRLVEVEGLKIGVFNVGGELLRDRGSLLARRRAAGRGNVRPRGLYR